MYYLLITGRIVTEREMRTAYEIVYGGKSDVHKGHYKAWLSSVKGIARIISKSEITIEQLIKGNCIVEAVKLVREKNGCTLVEANKIVREMREANA